MRSRSAESGLSLIEVTVALSILAILSIALVGSIAQAQRLTNLSRERAVAFGACRSYIEEMRGLTLTAVMNDARTPADFVPTSTAESLRGARGEVSKVDHESGAQATVVSGAKGAATTSAAAAFAEGAALGFPRNLTDAAGATENPAPAEKLIIVPARVRLAWTSATGGTHTATIYTTLGGNE